MSIPAIRKSTRKRKPWGRAASPQPAPPSSWPEVCLRRVRAAAAGLNRLGRRDIGHRLDAEAWLPAPGQGAILVEARADDAGALALLTAIDDAPSRAALLTERALLAALGGSCHSPVAVLGRHEGALLRLTVALFSPDGAHRITGEACFAPGDLAAPTLRAAGLLAADLLARAPAAIGAHFAGPA